MTPCGACPMRTYLSIFRSVGSAYPDPAADRCKEPTCFEPNASADLFGYDDFMTNPSKPNAEPLEELASRGRKTQEENIRSEKDEAVREQRRGHRKASTIAKISMTWLGEFW